MFLFSLGISWIRVYKPEGFKAQNFAIVANHVTVVDALVVVVVFWRVVTGVAISWLAKAPIISTVIRAHHVLTVEREPKTTAKAKVSPESDVIEKPKSNTETIVEYQKLCASDSRFPPLLVFPEGTTHDPYCLAKFRTGAFVAGEPVQPVGIVWPEGMGWSGSLGTHFLDILTRWWACVDVHVLPPYYPNAEELQNPGLYAQNVQQCIAKSMGLKPEQSSTKFNGVQMLQLGAAYKKMPRKETNS